MKRYSRLSLFLFVIIAVVSVKGQQKYCDSLRGEIPRFCKLIEDEAIEEFPKDYSRIGKCIEASNNTGIAEFQYDEIKGA